MPIIDDAHAAQIKSRDRVRELAEVYTHESEVNAMLDLVADMLPSVDAPDVIDKKFLEPSCGSGNFLVEVLRRKLTGAVTPFDALRALASIYAIDINEENVGEARGRLRELMLAHSDRSDCGYASAVDAILTTNVIVADTLANEADDITFIDYRVNTEGEFIRVWEPLNPVGLFGLFGVEQDVSAVHYSALAATPEPTK